MQLQTASAAADAFTRALARTEVGQTLSQYRLACSTGQTVHGSAGAVHASTSNSVN